MHEATRREGISRRQSEEETLQHHPLLPLVVIAAFGRCFAHHRPLISCYTTMYLPLFFQGCVGSLIRAFSLLDTPQNRAAFGQTHTVINTIDVCAKLPLLDYATHVIRIVTRPTPHEAFMKSLNEGS